MLQKEQILNVRFVKGIIDRASYAYYELGFCDFLIIGSL